MQVQRKYGKSPSETSPARSAGVSLEVARKKTKPGLDGAGGRYVPTATSRAWAGSGALGNSTAVSAAPTTSSLLWLAAATRGAGRGTASSAEGTPCGGEAQRGMMVGTGSRSEVKSGDEAIFGGTQAQPSRATGLTRAAGTPYPPHHTTRRERPRYFGAPLHWTQSKHRRTWCARAARQRPLVSRVQDKIKSCPGTYWRAAEPSGSSASGNGSGTGGRSRGFGLPRGSCARPRRRRPLRQGSLPAPFPLFQYVPLQLSYLSRHLALVNLVGIQSFSFYCFVLPPKPKSCCCHHGPACSDPPGRGGAWRHGAAPRRAARMTPNPRNKRR
jgi:hypothetical protein